MLGVATGLLAGGGGPGTEPGMARYLTGPTGAGGQYAPQVEKAFKQLVAPNPLEVPGQQEQGYLQRIQGFADRSAVDPLEAQGLMTQAGTANPDANLAAAKSYLNTISGPAIANAATAAGMGRGGAGLEALAGEGTRMTLPILQDSLNAQRQLGQQEQMLGGQLRDRDLANLQTALSAAEAPRLAELQSTTKPQNLLLSAYGLPPMASGAGVNTFTGAQNYYPSTFSTVMKSLQGVASIAGAFMMCWVAEAAWGCHDPRFWTAWRYVNFDPSRRASVIRFVYKRVGRRLARWGNKRVLGWLLERVIPRV